MTSCTSCFLAIQEFRTRTTKSFPFMPALLNCSAILSISATESIGAFDPPKRSLVAWEFTGVAFKRPLDATVDICCWRFFMS